jgi:peptidoglycan/xylan/chitin deacetylase (PgdA/CDA1 family)
MGHDLRVCLTVDLEQDCPPFRQSYDGIERGLPLLADLLAEEAVQSTFFTTGDVARRFPDAVEALVRDGHELGCHGDTHRRFDELCADEAAMELRTATQTLRAFAPVTSFRAPNLAFPVGYLPLLEELGYVIDSSLGKHKVDYWRSRKRSGIRRIPASTTSSVLRLPRMLRNPLFSCLSDPVVLFVHPWEFVDWRASTLRLDCRFRTGQKALDCLQTTLQFFRRRGAKFLRMCDLLSN